MINLKKVLAGAAISIAALGFLAAPASATPLTVGTGWQYDQVNAADTPSVNSPLTFTGLAGHSYQFSLTDGFVVGDTYTITLDGVDVFTTTPGLTATPFVNNLGPAAATFAPDWIDPAYSKIALQFGVGDFSFVVTGDGAGGLPAGFGYRLDQIPEPVTLSLFGAGLAGAAAMRRRKKKVA
jgi:hypothetical protein